MTQTGEQVRARGRDRFIVREGLHRRGAPFGVPFGLFQIIRIVFFRSSSEPLLGIIADWGFATVAFGAIMGVIEWQAHERDYQKPTDEDDVA